MLMNAIEQAYGGSGRAGALNAVMDKNREQRMTEKADAVRKGTATGGKGDVDAKLRGVAEEFVSVFMNQVMKSMRANVQQNPEMHGDNGEKFFQDLLDTEYSKTMASGSGYGLTDLVYQALTSKARVRQAPAAGGASAAADTAGVSGIAGE